jgi:p-aminobenzoyl-glutamate transporter AbgT
MENKIRKSGLSSHAPKHFSPMKKDYLYALLAGVAYIAVVSFVIFDVANMLEQDVNQQRYMVPLALGGIVFILIVFFLVRENKKEETDDGY